MKGRVLATAVALVLTAGLAAPAVAAPGVVPWIDRNAHEVAEVTALKHRTLRYLVERAGFRSVAFEESWTLGLALDEFVRTGEGDVGRCCGRPAAGGPRARRRT